MNDLMDSIMQKSFRMFIESMDENGSQKLLFPCKRIGMPRHSEQEFRQMLIKAIEETDGIKRAKVHNRFIPPDTNVSLPPFILTFTFFCNPVFWLYFFS